ncbi:hypothetical protein ACF0H5_023231 [Mactra antiquata]
MSEKETFLAMYDGKPDVTKEIIKTTVSNTSTRREYLRMKEEQKLRREQSGVTSCLNVIHEEPPSRKHSVTDAKDDVIKIQTAEPDVTSFPFIDKVDGNPSHRHVKALEAEERPRTDHKAKWCMVSAVVHMRCLQQRRAKSIRELRKKPTTTLSEKTKSKKTLEFDSSDSEDEKEGPLDYLKKCRYIRGHEPERELTIEEIFG